MFRYCKIKKCIIGFDRPKVCVSLVGKTPAEVLAQAERIAEVSESSTIDMVELRGDYLSMLSDYEQLDQLLSDVAHTLPDTVFLFTIRSENEGGEKLGFTKPSYYDINRHVIERKLADIVDIELFSGAEQVEELVKYAHEHDVKVLMSNHDFQTTPDASVIVNRLRMMQDFDADIAKVAVMPKNRMQVANLLAATAMMQEGYAEIPIITMSMGKLGAISRVSGAVFGSAVTFASLEQASAPGQIPVEDMNRLLDLVEKYCAE